MKGRNTKRCKCNTKKKNPQNYLRVFLNYYFYYYALVISK